MLRELLCTLKFLTIAGCKRTLLPLFDFRQYLSRWAKEKGGLIAIFLSVSGYSFYANAADLNGGVLIYKLRSSDVLIRPWDGNGTDEGLQETWDITRPPNLNNGTNDDFILTPPDDNDIVIIPGDGRVSVKANSTANAETIEFKGDIEGVAGNALLLLDQASTLTAKKIIARGDTGDNRINKSTIIVNEDAQLKVAREISAEFTDIEIRKGLIETQTLSLLMQSSVENEGGEFNVKDIRIDDSSIKSLTKPVKNIFGNGVIIEKIEVEERTEPSEPGFGNLGSLFFDFIVYGPTARALFDISGLSAGTSFDQIISSHLDYGGNELVFNMQQGPFMYPSDSLFHLFQSDVYSNSPSMVSLLAQGTTYEGLDFMKTSENTYRTDRTPYNQFLLFQADTGTLYVKEVPVPGPLPIMGLGVFASYTRSLRKLSSRFRSMDKITDIM